MGMDIQDLWEGKLEGVVHSVFGSSDARPEPALEGPFQQLELELPIEDESEDMSSA